MPAKKGGKRKAAKEEEESPDEYLAEPARPKRNKKKNVKYEEEESDEKEAALDDLSDGEVDNSEDDGEMASDGEVSENESKSGKKAKQPKKKVGGVANSSKSIFDDEALKIKYDGNPIAITVPASSIPTKKTLLLSSPSMPNVETTNTMEFVLDLIRLYRLDLEDTLGNNHTKLAEYDVTVEKDGGDQQLKFKLSCLSNKLCLEVYEGDKIVSMDKQPAGWQIKVIQTLLDANVKRMINHHAANNKETAWHANLFLKLLGSIEIKDSGDPEE